MGLGRENKGISAFVFHALLILTHGYPHLWKDQHTGVLKMSTSRKVRVECFVNQLGFYSFYKLFFVFGEYSDVNSIQLIVLRRNISKYNKITKLSAHWVTWSIMNLRPIKRLLQEQNDVLCLTYERVKLGFPHSSVGKESSCKAGDLGLIPGSGRSSGEGNGNWLQYSCLENSTDRGVWRAKGSQRARQDWSNLACTHAQSGF